MADTLMDMIFGFSVILGVLGVYILILAVRFRRARSKNQEINKFPPES